MQQGSTAFSPAILDRAISTLNPEVTEASQGAVRRDRFGHLRFRQKPDPPLHHSEVRCPSSELCIVNTKPAFACIF